MTAERWRLLLDEPVDGSANMARDEALMLAAAAGAPPTLRLYGWSRPTLSLGANQETADADLGHCRIRGIDLVRRPTGGGAVLHAEEVTYAVAARVGEGALPGSVIGVYERISEALIRALRRLGVDAEAARPSRAGRSPASCFGRPSAREILASGRKLVGSAQVRRRRTCLQHGSLLLAFDAERLAAVLPAARGAPIPACLHDLSGRSVDRGEVEEALVAGFEETLGIRLVPGAYTSSEMAEATRLRTFKYLDAAWTLERRLRTDDRASVG